MKKTFFLVLMLALSIMSAGATFPDSNDVEPKIESGDVIKGGIENTYTVSLEECMRFALGNNPRIQAAMQDVFASDARLRETWAAYFPQFSWQSGYSRIRQLQLSDVFSENLIYSYWVLGQISASQMLYDFGVTQNQATIRRLDRDGYKIILTGTVNDVLCKVKNAYYNLQYAVEQKRVAEEMMEKYALFYKQALALYKAGTKPKVDVTIAQVNLSNSKLSMIQAEHGVKVAMAKLSNTMGLPYYNKYIPADCLNSSTYEISLDKAIEITKDSRPEFQLAGVKTNQAMQNVKLVQKSFLPQFTIEGQYQIGGKHPTSNYGYNFGGYLNFPTINGMLIKNEIKEARALYSKQQALAESTRNNIYFEVQQSYYELNEKKNQIPVAYLGMQQAKENYELSYGRYKVGVGNPVELEDAQTQYRDAQLTYCKTVYEYNTSKANLEKAIGRNLVSAEVVLPKQKRNS